MKIGKHISFIRNIEFLLYFQGLPRKTLLSYDRKPTLVFRGKQLRFSQSGQLVDEVSKLKNGNPAVFRLYNRLRFFK